MGGAKDELEKGLKGCQCELTLSALRLNMHMAGLMWGNSDPNKTAWTEQAEPWQRIDCTEIPSHNCLYLLQSPSKVISLASLSSLFLCLVSIPDP